MPQKDKSKWGDKNLDKNLQDDWIPNQTRSGDATSVELPEYGGDLKEKENIMSKTEKGKHKLTIKEKQDRKKEKLKQKQQESATIESLKGR